MAGLGMDAIEHCKAMSEETGIPYQNLIGLYLRHCLRAQRKLSLKWLS